VPEVELRQVTKRYGDGAGAVCALDPVDLDLDHGEVVAIVGPSGCGKTTLLRTLAGLTAPTRGSISVDGSELWSGDRPQQRALRSLAVVFQEANLLPWMTVEENVALPLRLRGVRRAERRRRAGDLCALTGIAGFERHRPRTLSIGMRQRAALARALIESPGILLLDEPFAALDAITREAMNLELQRVLAHEPRTTVLVTHSISEAVFLADRVVSLTARPGRVADVVPVPFERPRDLDLLSTTDFQKVVGGIRSTLQEHS
jgi:NitT/TauT family transport system ATP-binding protein